jgi:hypothetical protein
LEISFRTASATALIKSGDSAALLFLDAFEKRSLGCRARDPDKRGHDCPQPAKRSHRSPQVPAGGHYIIDHDHWPVLNPLQGREQSRLPRMARSLARPVGEHFQEWELDPSLTDCASRSPKQSMRRE